MPEARGTRAARRAGRFAAGVLALFGSVLLNNGGVPINATTAALYMLVVVLGVAAWWGMAESIFVSLAGVLVFNYYFLPPVGTFTIDDPENWVALAAFLVTAVTASKLSDDARRRAAEATAGRNEMARLYELSRALLLEDGPDSVARSVLRAGQILQVGELAFFDAGARRVFGQTSGSGNLTAELEHAAETGTEWARPGAWVFPVRMGTTVIGSLAITLPGGSDEEPLNRNLRESTASLIAINHQRALARERATAAEAARRNEEFKTALLDGLAHDLKTPLTAIRTCITSLIAFPAATEQLRQELLGIIDTSSLRLQASITEAVELARIESRELRLEKAWTPVYQIVEDAVAASGEDEAPRHSAAVDPELHLFADAGLVRRALSQVLENARKYSPPGSGITIEAEALEKSVVLRVLDRGPGIAAGDRERIFEKFYRSPSVRTRIEGTGMGLAIAKGIIEAHGGKIRAENRQGGGAVIVLTLPVAADQTEPDGTE